MGNGISLHPADLTFDYRPLGGRLKRRQDQWIGFFCSLSVNLGMIVLGGVVLIKPVEFGVDQGLSGMEVELVAGAEEESIAAPREIMEDPPPVIQEPTPEPEPVFVQEKEPEQLPAEVEKISSVGNSSIDASAGQGAEMEMQPSYLRNPAPPYPLEARRNGWEGVVTLDVIVNPSGHPVNVTIQQSSGYATLDKAAVKAVKAWRFRPARMGNVPVESRVRIPVRFEFKN